MTGSPSSEGVRLLLAKLPKLAKKWGVTPRSAREELARRVGGVSRSTISRYLSGDRKPDRERAIKLQEVAGVPMSSWDEPPQVTDPPFAATGS